MAITTDDKEKDRKTTATTVDNHMQNAFTRSRGLGGANAWTGGTASQTAQPATANQSTGSAGAPVATQKTAPLAGVQPQYETSHTVGPLDAQNGQYTQERADALIAQTQGYNNYASKAQDPYFSRDTTNPMLTREEYNQRNPIVTQTKEPTVSGTKNWRDNFEKKETEDSLKRKRLNAGIVALGDSLRHIGNLYYTYRGAVPQQYKYGYKQHEAEEKAERELGYKKQQDADAKAYKRAMDSYNIQFNADKAEADRAERAQHNREMEAVAKMNAESQAKARGAQADYTAAKAGYLPQEQERKQKESDAKIARWQEQTDQGRARLAQNQQRISLAYSKEARISGGEGRGSGGSKNDYMDVTYGDGTKRVHLNSYVKGASQVYDELVKDGTYKPPFGKKMTPQDMAAVVLSYPHHPKVRAYTERMERARNAGTSTARTSSGGGSKPSTPAKKSKKVTFK